MCRKDPEEGRFGSLLGSVVNFHQNHWIVHSPSDQEAGELGSAVCLGHPRTCWVFGACAGARNAGARNAGPCWDSSPCWEGSPCPGRVQPPVPNNSQRPWEALKKGICLLFTAHLGKLCLFVVMFITKAKPPCFLFLLFKSSSHT